MYSTWEIIQCTFLVVVVLLTLLCNTLCFFVTRLANNINVTTKMFIFSLSLSDFCFGLFFGVPLIGSTAVGSNKWPYSEISCSVVAFFMVSLSTTSLLNILALNYDRYLAISRPLHYLTLMTTKRALVIAVMCWVLAFCWTSLLAFLPGQKAFYRPEWNTCFFDPEDEYSIDYLGIMSSLSLIVVPIIASIVIFCKIYGLAKRHARQIAAQEVLPAGDGSTRDRRRAVDKKAAIAFLMVAVGFVCSWLPTLINFIYVYVTQSQLPTLPYLAEISVLAGSFWNIFIYYWKNEAFRRAAMKLLSKWFGCSRQIEEDATVSTLSSRLN